MNRYIFQMLMIFFLHSACADKSSLNDKPIQKKNDNVEKYISSIKELYENTDFLVNFEYAGPKLDTLGLDYIFGIIKNSSSASRRLGSPYIEPDGICYKIEGGDLVEDLYDNTDVRYKFKGFGESSVKELEGMLERVFRTEVGIDIFRTGSRLWAINRKTQDFLGIGSILIYENNNLYVWDDHVVTDFPSGYGADFRYNSTIYDEIRLEINEFYINQSQIQMGRQP